jgi:hypothetical protein
MTKIILSYRRSDSDAIAGRIRDKLASHYGDDSVFMDIDSIPFGLDFREHVKAALLENDILIAVIGPRWIGPNTSGRFRINEETDPVRIEVETALLRKIPVVPVLVGGADMPSTAELPDGLKDLAFRNAAQIDAGRDFHQHMDRLIRSMDRILELNSVNEVSSRFDDGHQPSSSVRKNVEQPPPRTESPSIQGSAGGGLNSVLTKYGIRFVDAETESKFLADYRERFYYLGQLATAIAVAGWLIFGSTALVASQGKDLASIKFFFIAAPILLIVFFASFLKITKQMWQVYSVLTTLVFIAMVYTSARVLQEQSWFRPEYVTMTFMGGMMLVGMAPILVIYTALLETTMAVVALYYIVFDLHMAEFPTLYAIFSGVFLGGTLVVGCCFAVIRETSLRREFSAARGLRHQGWKKGGML